MASCWKAGAGRESSSRKGMKGVGLGWVVAVWWQFDEPLESKSWHGRW